MKTYVKILSRIVLLVLISCASTNTTNTDIDTGIRLENGKPYWYWRPNATGKTGGVGIAGRHIKGYNAQRTLVIHRAIDDISRQMGVKVKNIVKTSASVKQNSVSTSMDVFSIQMVEGKTVTAVIKEFWENPATDELYVWMVVQ